MLEVKIQTWWVDGRGPFLTEKDARTNLLQHGGHITTKVMTAIQSTDDTSFREKVIASKDPLECPTCGRKAKLYPRSLNSTMARFLIWLNRTTERTRLQWIHPNNHKEEFVKAMGRVGGCEHSKLCYWGLVEEKPKDIHDGDKKNSGYWRITAKGQQFVRCQITVPAKAMVLFNEPISFKGKEITIIDALGKKFSYRELMGYDTDE